MELGSRRHRRILTRLYEQKKRGSSLRGGENEKKRRQGAKGSGSRKGFISFQVPFFLLSAHPVTSGCGFSRSVNCEPGSGTHSPPNVLGISACPSHRASANGGDRGRNSAQPGRALKIWRLGSTGSSVALALRLSACFRQAAPMTHEPRTKQQQ